MRAVRRADRMLVIAMKITDKIVTMTTVEGVRTMTSYRGAVGVLNGLMKVSNRRLQAHSRKEAHDRSDRSPECRFDEQESNELARSGTSGLEDRQLASTFRVAQVHANRPEVNPEQQDWGGEREVDDPLNRDRRGEVADRIPDVVDGHATLRREDLVDLAVEAREVSLGRRKVVRVEKPIPIDSDFSRNEIPAVRDHAQLLFIPVDIPYLDECCRGRVERTHASRWILEEAADRHIDACECLVSGDVVRTVHESGGAAQGDVHLPGAVLGQRDL